MAGKGGKKKTTWKKGESGNPSGRPKSGETFNDILNDLLKNDFIETKIDDRGKRTTINKGNAKKALTQAWIIHAIKGSIGHLKELLDRMEGKVPDKLKVGGDGGESIKISEIVVNRDAEKAD